jgi:hypothetical protein
VSVGSQAQLRAIVISAPAGEIAWSVDGIPGGGPTTGRIAPDGAFTAPADLPPGGTVVIAATLASDPAVRGELQAAILPPPSTPGAARVLASAGATVYSDDGRAAARDGGIAASRSPLARSWRHGSRSRPVLQPARLDNGSRVREIAPQMQQRPPILIVREPVPRSRVEEYAHAWFGDMVKIVADTERNILSLGGELHADGEKLLLADGSCQDDLWGANVFPFRPTASRLEFTALINIRPRLSNRTMEVQSPTLREAIRAIVELLLPTGAAP